MLNASASMGFAKKPDNILIVSIDALVPDALSDTSSPFLAKMMRQGIYSLKAKSVDPPLTLVSHSAMITGLSPVEGGRKDNSWAPGEPTVTGRTLFHAAKAAGYGTGFFYAKQKLGFLVNSAIDKHELSAFPADKALDFVKPGNSFVFVHINGLDVVGPEFGWLSKQYLEELGYIDSYLKPLVEHVLSQKSFCIIILSDHGGHGKLHGCNHSQDFRIPIIVLQSRDFIRPADLTGFKTNDLAVMLVRVLK